MEFIRTLIDFFLHLDQHLGELISNYGVWTYLILFLIIFCETGLVVTPFLPGDSLLFAAGTFAALGHLNVFWLFVILTVAAIIGDTVNYWLGHYVERTHEFYEKYGGKTIIIARFIPIIRTFAPFVAGIGNMTYWRFITYNVVGGIVWVAVCVFAGYFFGNIPVVKRNFSLVILAIIFISVLPIIIEYVRHRSRSRKPVNADIR
jgi:membrane-associated protein